MATFEFVLPELGEGIESGDVVQLLVAVGDTVTAEQPVLELETDKAVVEVPAPVAGKVVTIHVRAGDKAQVGQPLVTIETRAAAEAAPTVETPAPESKAVSEEAALAQEAPETPESVAVSPPPAARPVVAAASPKTAVPAPRVSPVAPVTTPGKPAAPAAPSVRRLAREIGVDINQVAGSGPGGRISIEDVKYHARTQRTAAVAAPTLPEAAALPDFSKWGAVQRQPMSNVRRATAQHMARAWATIPHVTQFDKADITELEQVRRRFGHKAEAMGGRLTVTAIVLKVVAAALKVFPQFNASVDMTTQEVVYKQYYHIGVAVDTERGLLVPVIRDVDQKNIVTIAAETAQIAERARTRKTTVEEMQGGTFTVTNLGGLGGTNFTPIINPPEVAILGLARGRMELVYRDGQFVPRLLLPLALSYDHRLIDGADGVRFLRWVVEALEEPFLMTLEG